MANTDFFSEIARGEYYGANLPTLNEGENAPLPQDVDGILLVRTVGNQQDPILLRDKTTELLAILNWVSNEDGTYGQIYTNLDGTPFAGSINDLYQTGEDEKLVEVNTVCIDDGVTPTSAKLFAVVDKDEQPTGATLYFNALTGAQIIPAGTETITNGACTIAPGNTPTSGTLFTAAGTTNVAANSVTFTNLSFGDALITLSDATSIVMRGGTSRTFAKDSADAALDVIAFDPTNGGANANPSLEVIQSL